MSGGEFLPYVGPVLAAIPAIAIGLPPSMNQGARVALAYLLLQQIESHIVTPNIMHSQTDIRPATVIVALTVGYTLGGGLGAIAAVPMFAAGRIVVLPLVAPALRLSAQRV